MFNILIKIESGTLFYNNSNIDLDLSAVFPPEKSAFSADLDPIERILEY